MSASVVSLNKEVHTVDVFRARQTPCAAIDRNIVTKIHNRLDSRNSRPGPKCNTDAKNASADSESNRALPQQARRARERAEKQRQYEMDIDEPVQTATRECRPLREIQPTLWPDLSTSLPFGLVTMNI
ncbi:hypothetical protein B0H14DRAFT_2584470 [Mycena olivaceomarginata]|nr:hypothetical protein B0H14DRAFT_2584470 [Mycena olivaceomarginata]